ncbi:MAG: ECF-type sigma factor [Pirellula sp.]|jgi:RNA polymerase sigma factor (TIGR02999 family)
MSDVTRLIEAANQGDHRAAADLLPLVYDELRKLASVRMAAEKPEHTLNATALVHEAYLRLIGDQQFQGRGHFFAAAATAMRRILIDRARKKMRRKHGGDRQRQEGNLELIAAPVESNELLDLDAALVRLSECDPVKARLVELRYFAGLTGDQAAEILGISPKTADRYWVYARAWLRREMEGSDTNQKNLENG